MLQNQPPYLFYWLSVILIFSLFALGVSSDEKKCGQWSRFWIIGALKGMRYLAVTSKKIMNPTPKGFSPYSMHQRWAQAKASESAWGGLGRSGSAWVSLNKLELVWVASHTWIKPADHAIQPVAAWVAVGRVESAWVGTSPTVPQKLPVVRSRHQKCVPLRNKKKTTPQKRWIENG